ncbi:MAG: HAD-IIA family hydrolase [Candidatus Verstraetearchaeota archaeon]|nr:HAD-IIA family hydrolase [Candidatus Verstraetearchaeota archaeon]
MDAERDENLEKDASHNSAGEGDTGNNANTNADGVTYTYINANADGGKDTVKNKIRGIRGFLIDLDGCVYRGDTLIEGSDVAIKALKGSGRKVLYLTNNSTKTPQEYAMKLRRLGVDADPAEILTSAVATAAYMCRFERSLCYVIGEEALRSALAQEGFTIVEEGNEGRAKYVVCGLDRGLTYGKLAAACAAVQRGAKFIATNTDPNLPVEGGYLPGAGSIVGAVRIATGVRPIVVGKPSRYIMEIALERLGLNKEKVAIVGDRIDIDVKAGKVAGIYTVLVSSGGYLKVRKMGLTPDLVVRSLYDLVALL